MVGDDIAALRQKVKYVFVIFNENRSFDHEYGTFPGVDGLYSDGKNPRAAGRHARLHGDLSRHVNRADGDGPAVPRRPRAERLVQGLRPTIRIKGSPPRSTSRTACRRWTSSPRSSGANTRIPAAREGEKAGTQFARLVMAHIDCDTIPFFWRYASRFTIFDNIFATEDTPSTPNAVAMIAGQSGETQWVKHPGPASMPTADGTTGPITGTINGKTYSGTATTRGAAARQRSAAVVGLGVRRDGHNGREPRADLAGRELEPRQHRLEPHLRLTAADDDGRLDQLVHRAGPQSRLRSRRRQTGHPVHRQLGGEPVQWRWYQNGYDLEPTDSGGVASHKAYVSHHNGAQYFGYISNNALEQTNLRGEGDFFADVAANALPTTGGVFYIRGGYYNLNYPKQTRRHPEPELPGPA